MVDSRLTELNSTYPPQAAYEFWVADIQHKPLERSTHYICLKSDSDVYKWIPVKDGGA